MHKISALLPKINQQKSDEFEIRDMRVKDHFFVDDLFFETYAQIVGIYAIGVYMALCRYANFNSQKCFPSIELIAEKLGISVPSVKRSVKILADHNLISIQRSRGIQGRWGRNIYQLHDKKYWQIEKIQGSIRSLGE